MVLPHDVAYRAVRSRDARFDGQFVTAVRTTRIYCRPACPARTPLPENVTFYPTAAAAQQAGYRACKRCLPDATPGSPEWNLRADTVGAAMRLIDDGVVDREGVPGLALRLGYTPRHLGRLLHSEVGAAPLALARARRATTARLLLTSTDLSVTEIAHAAGFSSVRQFNDTIREIFDTDPTGLRRRAGRRRATGAQHSGRAVPVGVIDLDLDLRVRPPFDGAALLRFLTARAVAGVESVDGRRYARTLDLPGGPGLVVLDLPDVDDPPVVHVRLSLAGLADLVPAVQRCRRLLDADADPVAVTEQLSTDPLLAPAVARRPGLRLPGAVDGPEIVVRAVVGQQVSVTAARTALGRLAARVGRRLPGALDGLVPGLDRLFPSCDDLATLDPTTIAGPGRRAAALVGAAAAIADGRFRIDPGRRSADLRSDLTALPGIGPWTAGYVAMRVLGDPDVLLTGDLALRRGAARLGLPETPRSLESHGRAWGPFRSYAGLHLWSASADPLLDRTDPKDQP